MATYDLLGYVAGALTTFAIVPQIRKVWRTRAAGDISVSTVAVLLCGVVLWTLYGVITNAWPIIITNGIAVVLDTSLLFLVFYEKRAGKS